MYGDELKNIQGINKTSQQAKQLWISAQDDKIDIIINLLS